MTLVLTVNGPETIWILADRRVSFQGKPPNENARKLMFLDSTDGVALLGYCGLGETTVGTEPSDWMSSVLRGRELPLEQCLSVLTDAMKRQIPKHLLCLPRNAEPAHNILVAAFVGEEARAYALEIAMQKNLKSFKYRYRRLIAEDLRPKRVAPRFLLGGTGGSYLNANRKWISPLLKALDAHDRQRVSDYAIADRLAALNEEVHLNTSDGSVGPRCIVGWRHRKGGKRGGGGAHQFFIKRKHDPENATIPAIARGIDLKALVKTVLPHALSDLKALLAGENTNGLDAAALNRDLEKLPSDPDEDLR